MMRNLRPVLLLLAALTLAAPAAAQTSDAQLRKENERLREENHRLQVQLDDLRQRLETLEKQMEELVAAIEALQRGEDAAITAPAQPEPKSAPLPDDPFAAPDALHAQLQKRYVEEFGEELPGSADELTRQRRAVDRWVGRMNREMRGDVHWIVDMGDITPEGPRVQATFQIVDPQSRQAIGEPFDVVVQRRLLRQPSPGDAAGLLIMEGAMNADLVYDPQRLERGMFNDPPFIGPFAAFGYELNVESLSPYEPNAEGGEGEEEGGG